MNRIKTIMTTLALGGLGTLWAAEVPLDNPGFEDGGSGWNLWTQSGSEAVGEVTYPTGGAHGGTRYARVEVTSPAASSGENWHIQFQPPSGWEASIGATYEFKFWAKSDSSLPIHVSVQGSDFTYITGQSFALSPEWTEYSITHFSDAEGVNGIRFFVYVAEAVGVYEFDDFSLFETPASLKAGAATKGRQALRVVQGADKLSLTLDGITENVKAELFDMRGTSLATAMGRADGSLKLAHPGKSGTYVVRASTATRAWFRTISIR